jgi:adenosylcobinamide amidohydrolase
MRLEMHWRQEDAASLPVAVWRAGPGCRMIASGVAGGGLGERQWVLNAQVAPAYSRMDPAAHVADLAAGLGLAGAGVGLLTAASVTDVVEREDEGVRVAATVGLRVPTWAAAASGTVDREVAPIWPADTGTVNREVAPIWPADTGTVNREVAAIWRPGTINVIVSVPVPLGDAAYVNAVITATEAKTQALLEAGIRATGTASDAICIAAPVGGEQEDFAGPRSRWGARIARAVHAAVHAGALGDASARRPAADGVGPGSVRSNGFGALPGGGESFGRLVEPGSVRTNGC